MARYAVGSSRTASSSGGRSRKVSGRRRKSYTRTMRKRVRMLRRALPLAGGQVERRAWAADGGFHLQQALLAVAAVRQDVVARAVAVLGGDPADLPRQVRTGRRFQPRALGSQHLLLAQPAEAPVPLVAGRPVDPADQPVPALLRVGPFPRPPALARRAGAGWNRPATAPRGSGSPAVSARSPASAARPARRAQAACRTHRPSGQTGLDVFGLDGIRLATGRPS